MQQKIEIQKLCETLNSMGRLKVYGNDAKSQRLSFVPHKMYSNEQATDLAADCLRKIGFTQVSNNKTKKDFYHSVSANIVCEYDLEKEKIQFANVKDIEALCNMFDYIKVWCTIFLPGKVPGTRKELPHRIYLAHLHHYLWMQSKHK